MDAYRKSWFDENDKLGHKTKYLILIGAYPLVAIGYNFAIPLPSYFLPSTE